MKRRRVTYKTKYGNVSFRSRFVKPRKTTKQVRKETYAKTLKMFDKIVWEKDVNNIHKNCEKFRDWLINEI